MHLANPPAISLQSDITMVKQIHLQPLVTLEVTNLRRVRQIVLLVKRATMYQVKGSPPRLFVKLAHSNQAQECLFVGEQI